MREKNYLYLVVIIIFLVSLTSIALNEHKEEKKKYNDRKNEISDTKSLKYFDSKYSINDMYDLISNNEIPYDDEEFFNIILNWYDYFGENNLFINHFGDSYSIDEYNKIKNKFSDETLKTLLVDAKKSWFLPVLSE